jgi:hypothetical protein
MPLKHPGRKQVSITKWFLKLSYHHHYWNSNRCLLVRGLSGRSESMYIQYNVTLRAVCSTTSEVESNKYGIH